MPRRLYNLSCLFLPLALIAAGCTTLTSLPLVAPSKTDGARPEVQQAAQAPETEFPGKVCLFRGGGGIFSLGMDTLAKQLTDIGVANEVDFHFEWWVMADRIAKERATLQGPLVLVGHSYGADAALNLAHKLDARNIAVDLIVTIDPTSPPTVPKNVKHAYNIYRDSGAWDVVPVWRGIPLGKAADAGAVRLENIHVQEHPDLNLPGLTHANIDDNPIIQQEAIRQILRTCKGQ